MKEPHALPQGDYRFRADRNGTQFWSSGQDDCTLPGCGSDSVTVTIPLTVTVAGTGGHPYAGLPVYAFDGDTYTGMTGTTDANGQLVFTLAEGSYRFRADYNQVQFWSGILNTCSVPGCTAAAVTIPTSQTTTSVTINYTYDSLYRLTAADYSDGTFFHYTYDAVGNRLTQQTQNSTDTYTYDAANRLTGVDGVAYTWDANGNLLSDGTNTYAYDSTNWLVSVTGPSSSVSYAYDGLGDRLQETVDGQTTTFVLDLVAGLTQVLADGTNTYLYGLGRIAQANGSDTEYFLGDALGSVRQLTDETGAVIYAASYTPYGEVLSSAGEGGTTYGFTGEQTRGYINLFCALKERRIPRSPGGDDRSFHRDDHGVRPSKG